MLPLELVDRLAPIVRDRILQDVTDGRDARELAPLCGRALAGVRWTPGGEVLLMLEPARLPDEPDAIAVRAAEVERVQVQGGGARGVNILTLHRARHPLTLWVSDIEGRWSYEREGRHR